jgi:hypothetical protein
VGRDQELHIGYDNLPRSLLGLGISHFWRFEAATASLGGFDLPPRARALYVLNDTCHVRGTGSGA